MYFPIELKEITLEEKARSFVVYEQYKDKRNGFDAEIEEVAEISLFCKIKGYNILKLEEVWSDANLSGVSTTPIDIIFPKSNLREGMYKAALKYANELANRKNVPLNDKTKLKNSS